MTPQTFKLNNTGLPTDVQDVGVALQRAADTLIMIVGLLAVIFLIVGGLQMTLSAGDPGKFKQGRETVLYSVVGIIVSIAAYGIVSFITGRL